MVCPAEDDQVVVLVVGTLGPVGDVVDVEVVDGAAEPASAVPFQDSLSGRGGDLSKFWSLTAGRVAVAGSQRGFMCLLSPDPERRFSFAGCF